MMITKTFRADTILAALEKVQQDLGPEAMIASVREVPGGSAWNVFAKSQIEVIAVKMDNNERPPTEIVAAEPGKKNIKPWSPSKGKPVSTKATMSIMAETLEGEKLATEIRRKIQAPGKDVDIKDSFDLEDEIVPEQPKPKESKKLKDENSSPVDGIHSVHPPLIQKIADQLLQQGIAEDLVKRLSKICADTLSPMALKDEKRVHEYLFKQLEACLRVKPGTVGSLPKTICLIGVSGSGKTSTIAKLAVHFSRIMDLKVSWVCADTYRTGAIAEAHAYADSIGIPLNIAYTPEDITRIVENQASSDVTLVDTPACNPRSEANLVELGTLLTVIPQRLTWVVASATTRENDLQNILAAFTPLRPRGLILTKMDETNKFGSIFNIAWRSQLPLIYYTFGSHVVNEIVPAKSDILVRALMNERFVV